MMIRNPKDEEKKGGGGGKEMTKKQKDDNDGITQNEKVDSTRMSTNKKRKEAPVQTYNR